MHKRLLMICTALATAAFLAPATASAGICDMDTDDLVALITDANAEAAAAGLDFQIQAIDCFVIGNGRPSVRILQQPFRWVPGDVRRIAQGDDITFTYDEFNNAGPILGSAAGSFPTAAVRAGQTTWGGDSCLSGVAFPERPSPAGFDITIFDGDFAPTVDFCPIADIGVRGDGFPFYADIVHAGWYPASCFGPTTLAFSVSFTFSGGDSNGDNYLDTALNEVYYNNAFAWGVNNAPLPEFDVRTVAFHEGGHSLGVGHFGPPPSAIMNPVYPGPVTTISPTDHAAMCTIWSQWPN